MSGRVALTRDFFFAVELSGGDGGGVLDDRPCKWRMFWYTLRVRIFFFSCHEVSNFLVTFELFFFAARIITHSHGGVSLCI